MDESLPAVGPEAAVVLDPVELDPDVLDNEELLLVVPCPYVGGAWAVEELNIDVLDSVDERLEEVVLVAPVDEPEDDEVVVVVTWPYAAA